MISSFKCKDTEALFRKGQAAQRFRPIAQSALRKLDMLDYADDVGDLRVPPGNRLERLRGDRLGQYSIRINDRRRICFMERGRTVGG